MAEVVWIDGQVVPAAEARVPVFDRGFLYGDSVYEVVRAFGGRPFRLGPHLDRLERSSAAIELAGPPRALVERAVAEALAASGEADAYVRIVVTRGGGPIGLDPALADAPRLIVIARAVNAPKPEAYRDGVEVAMVARGRTDPEVKSGNYLPSVLGTSEARRRGAYEAILSDGVGRLTEGGSSNFFVVRARRLATPPLTVGLLPGITRAAVIEVARADGLAVDEQPLWPTDLLRADEAFLTSSIRGVLPVVRVVPRTGAEAVVLGDGKPGPITRRVMALYDALVARETAPPDRGA
jgi:branched-chain amino acid aminotransferase